MQELIKNIEQWAEERNLIEGSTPQKQMLKLMEEFGELCSGIAKNKLEVIEDSIGDCAVVLIILSKQTFEPSPFYDAIIKSCEIAKNVDSTSRFLLETDLLLASSSLGRLSRSIVMLDSDEVLESLVSVIGALNILSIRLDLNITDCIQLAYNQIKDRKGKMIDGVFVKEEDLQND
ncbi:hypothetical protein BKK56_04190 [Rodentibacter genomosp. 2]|uniref:MazG-like family protein n=1 Tax=Rodentibacter genomosp. 2 TaxID=1908266 RepID=UPI0009863918|nr:hypothetical protein BKK56_04190 [Rodentibacter genomosp. 2]